MLWFLHALMTTSHDVETRCGSRHTDFIRMEPIDNVSKAMEILRQQTENPARLRRSGQLRRARRGHSARHAAAVSRRGHPHQVDRRTVG